MPAGAQTSSTGLYVAVNPTTVLAGEWAGVAAIISNNSSGKARITVTFTAVSPCGVKMDLGYNRLALAPGQSVQVTTAYAVPSDACRGMHEIIVTANSGGKGGGGTSASAYLAVQ
jgi:hypothetical protein